MAFSIQAEPASVSRVATVSAKAFWREDRKRGPLAPIVQDYDALETGDG